MSGPEKNERPEDDALERLLAKAGITMEELMAFADRVELAVGREDAVCAALRNNPELIEVLRGFLFTNSDFFRAPFDKVESQPVPERLLEPLREPEEPPPVPPRPRRFRLPLPIFGKYRTPVFAFAAVAAVVVLAIWLPNLTGYSFVGPEGRGIAAPASFQQVLEKSPTGTTVELVKSHLSIKPTATYYTNQNVWCREYDLQYGDDVQQAARACRGSDGIWRVWKQTDTQLRTPDQQGFGTASGPGEKLEASRRALLGDHRPLPLGVEADVMRRGWKR